MCPTEEYAKRGRIWVWFSPPIPPTSAFNEATKKINEDWIEEEDIIKTKSGTTFCQVAKIRHMGQLMEFITEGNQKWNGAIPSFTSMPINTKILNSAE